MNRSLLLFLFLFSLSLSACAQFTVSGTIYDSSRSIPVEGVRIVSTGGVFAISDSLGHYHIPVHEQDSLTFIFRNKPTQKFPVKNISTVNQFDLSLHVNIHSKYKAMKEVLVFAHSYRQDSLENRQTYADVFDYRRPGVRTSISPSGGVGADVDELINIFRFKRNRQLKAFRSRLLAQEEEKYINYRFSKNNVRRITHLDGKQLDTFLIKYRPSYEFASGADEVQFNQYVLNCYYHFRMEVLRKE